MLRRLLTFSVCVQLAHLSAGQVIAVAAAPSASPTAEQVKFFENSVRPLLVAHCIKCHGPEEQNGDLRLDSRGGILAGGDSGPAIEPGDPAGSLLIEAIRYDSLEMPPKGKLPQKDIDTLIAWVKMGAPWPGDAGDGAPIRKESKITDEDRAWWAFQPVRDFPVPQVEGDDWSHNDIDRFIYDKLKQEGIEPSGEAAKRQLIRRLYFDLVGLPPAPEEVQAFLDDDSPAAYEKLVDRLLDSPHYGEKWARHWLDLVRYAESDGYKADGYRPESWRYRDYVIRSFNDDKPYDRFILEQLAGDEIAPGDRDAQAATMFLRHGMYEYNQRDVRGQWSMILNEIVDTTSDVFLGMGMSCARCHDHKFDPLLQKDYYRLQAFFAPLMWHKAAPLADVPTRDQYQQQLARWEAMTAEIRRELEEIERPVLLRHAGGEGFAKFTPDLQAMIMKRPGDRQPLEHQLAEMAARQYTLDHTKLEERLKGEMLARWRQLREELANFDEHKPQPLPQAKFAVSDVGTLAPATFIAGKERLGEIAPGFLSVLDESDAVVEPPHPALQSTGRRTALARWIASEQNPLSTRVIVNRVWQYHFGAGLAANSSDFGRLGEPPSHPELLDWLTSRFVEQGWRLKPLHRMIVSSAAYRQSALREDAAAMDKDPHNHLLWRQNIRRLDAEQIRDAVLAATGELDRKIGGASVGHAAPRRTVYTKVMRNTQDPLLAVFDAPDALASSAERLATTTATQSLFMMNGPWALQRAEALARRVQAAKPSSESELVERAWGWVFGRAPTADEMRQAIAFLHGEGREDAPAEETAPSGENRTAKPAAAPLRDGQGDAARFKPGSRQERLEVPFDVSLPAGDFTVEAFVQLDSIFEDASVRTIAAHWNANSADPGWSLGVTSKRSKHTPRNLILQLSGLNLANEPQYEVVPSGIILELGKPYFVAVSVKIADTSESGATFFVKELFGEGRLRTAQAKHSVVLDYRPQHALTIGGRAVAGKHGWDGLVDDVRISNKALTQEELLITMRGDRPAAHTAGFWRFEAELGFYADSSANKNDLRPAGAAVAAPARSRLVDLCHVLLNSNEFLYVD